MTAILNEIREGVLLGHAQEQLNARADADFVPPDDEFWLTLAPTNRLVTARNRQHLERLPGDELVHHAQESGDLSLFDPPVEETLRFKVGAQVMMLNNDQGDRWVNGTIGRVVGVDYDRYGAVVEVEFADGSCADVTPFTWEATRPVVAGGSLTPRGDRHVHPAAVQAGVGDHDPQEPGADAGPSGRRPHRRHVLDGPAVCGVEPVHVVGRAGAETSCAAEGSEDGPTHRTVPAHLGRRCGGARRYCAIGMLTVGDEGRMSRPRPVELAVAFDDGTAVTTLINPQRDLADARKAFGISVSDVLLAPTLREAWAVIAPMLAGCTPVGVGVDETLGLIDFELKRLGHVTAMPLGVELRGVRVSGADGAGAGAVGVEGARRRRFGGRVVGVRGTRTGGDDFGSAGEPRPLGADAGGRPPAGIVGAAAGEPRRRRGGVGCARHRFVPAMDTPWDAAARQSVADQLRAAAARAQLTEEVVTRLQEASALLGVEIVSDSVFLERDDIGDGPGAGGADLLHRNGAGQRGTGRGALGDGAAWRRRRG